MVVFGNAGMDFEMNGSGGRGGLLGEGEIGHVVEIND